MLNVGRGTDYSLPSIAGANSPLRLRETTREYSERGLIGMLVVGWLGNRDRGDLVACLIIDSKITGTVLPWARASRKRLKRLKFARATR